MKLKLIKEKLSQILLNLTAVKTDKAVLNYDGEELVEGTEVWAVDEDGNKLAVEDGDYTTEDNKVISVADGKVTKIEEKKEEEEEPQEEEQAQEEELTKEQQFAQKRETLSVSYSEKEWAVSKAFDDNEIKGWVFECGDTYAVIEEYDDDYNFVGFYRYAIEVDENANVTIDKDSKVEVVQRWVEKDEKKEEEVAEEEKPQEEQNFSTDEFEKINDTLNKIMERLDKVEKLSVNKPIEVELQNNNQNKLTGDKKIDRFIERYGK